MLLSNKIIGTIFLIICVFLVFSADLKIGREAREVAGQVFKPILKASNLASYFLKHINTEFRSSKDYQEENLRLKNTIQLLEHEIMKLREFEPENKRLKSLIGLSEQIQFDTLPANIIGRDLSGWAHVVIIDKGTKDNIKEEMPVISPKGVVGKVVEAGPLSSKVELLIDKQSQIGGIMQKSRIVGLVEGTGSSNLVMNYLPRDEEVLIGDLVLSSGLGGVYHKGMVIGTVKEVHEGKLGLYKYAVLAPAVSFSKLEEVLVILNNKKSLDDQ